ncbi:MAG: DUF2339 domain-containing protein, partial [Acidobacteria bacterium]
PPPREAGPPRQQPPVAPRTPPPASPPVVPAMVDARRAASMLERLVGVRLAVWVAAAALALGGIYLTAWAIQRQFLGPTGRTIAGLLLAAAMLGAGEYFRTRIARIAAALSAAGIAVLDATLLAATSLYHLLPVAAGLVLIGLATALALMLSLVHGPIVAGIALVGGFVTPALLGTGAPDSAVLGVWLLGLTAAVALLTRKRGWGVPAALAALALTLWIPAWALLVERPTDPVLGAFLLLVLVPLGAIARGADRPRWLVRGATGLAAASVLFGAFVVTARGDFTGLSWTWTGAIAVALVAYGRILERDGQWVLGALGPLGALLVYWAWTSASGTPVGTLPGRVGLDLGLALFGAGFAATLGSHRPARWAALSAASLPAFLLAGWWSGAASPLGASWSWPALGAALLTLPALRPFVGRDDDEARAALGTYAAGAVALVALAAGFAFRRELISAAWAIEVLAIGAIWFRIRVPRLRFALLGLAGLVTVRLLVNPAVLDYPLGRLPVFNALLWGYGVPAAAFLACGAILRRGARVRDARLLEIPGVLFAVLLVIFEIRHAIHRAPLGHGLVSLAEWGLAAAVLLVAGWLVAEHAPRLARGDLVPFGRVLVSAGLVLAVLVPAIIRNPLHTGEAVGARPVFNALVPGLLVPALAALACWWRLPADRWGVRRACGVVAGVLVFVWLTLAIRQLWHGTALVGRTQEAELYTYSAAWVVFGLVLFAFGVRGANVSLRRAGMLVLVLVTLKVFLVDTAQLAGLYRVISLIGLGLGLLVIAWAWQRYVESRGANAGSEEADR